MSRSAVVLTAEIRWVKELLDHLQLLEYVIYGIALLITSLSAPGVSRL